MKSDLERIVGRCMPRREKRNVVIVFHSVGERCPDSQSASLFRAQIERLRQLYRIVSASDLLQRQATGQTGMAVITFDDGYADNYEVAFPILQQLGVPFTVFIATAFVQGTSNLFEWSPQYRGLRALTWPQLREMKENGATIGTHTHRHRRLARCSTSELNYELTLSKLIIDQELSMDTELLAYPFGQTHDFDRRSMDVAAEAGFAAAFTTIQTTFTTASDFFELPRITINANETLSDFEDKICGRRDFMGRVERFRSAMIASGLTKPNISDDSLGSAPNEMFF